MSKLNVLLIDDNEATNFLHRHVLQRSGKVDNITAFTDASQALAFLYGEGADAGEAKGRQPNIIFLDINMPTMNGWDFLEFYHDLPTEDKAGTVVVMLTTSLNPDDEARALATDDVTAFAHKPLNRTTLNKIIEQYIVAA